MKKVTDITLSVDFDIFCEEIFPYVNSISSISLESIIYDEFFRQLNQSAAGQIFDLMPKVKVTGWPERHSFVRYCKVGSFAEILGREWFVPFEHRYDYYTGILFQAHADKAISTLNLTVDEPLCVIDEAELQLWKHRVVEQKKLNKHMYRMHLNHPSAVYEPFRTAHCDCESSLFMSNPSWGVLDFQCRICGKHYYCSCCESFLKQYFYRDKGMQLIAAEYDNREFRPNLCHLCRGVSPELENWDSNKLSFSSKYAPYIQWEFVKEGLSSGSSLYKDQIRNAENRLRVRFGYPKIGEGWISEVNLLNTIKELYPQTEVVHQGSPEWLGLQRFDVWLPEFNVAVEYQGKQHYEPIEYFGGTDGFHRCQERDARKRHLSEKNNVEIVYFSYKESLTTDLVREKLTKAIAKKRASV